MKKRILAMLLALLMLAPAALTSCSEGTENAETTAADTSAAPTAGEEAAEEVNVEELSPAEQRALIPDNLPEMTFDGRSYIFAVEEAKAYEIISEELTGEATNDAVYDRLTKNGRRDTGIVADGNVDGGFSRARNKPYAKSFRNIFRGFRRQCDRFGFNAFAGNAAHVCSVSQT